MVKTIAIVDQNYSGMRGDYTSCGLGGSRPQRRGEWLTNPSRQILAPNFKQIYKNKNKRSTMDFEKRQLGYEIRTNKKGSILIAIRNTALGTMCIFMVCANVISDHYNRIEKQQKAQEATLEIDVNPETMPVKVGASDFQNEMIAYAWEMSGKDFDFIRMIEAESGWILDRVSPYNSNGHRDWGLGQISSYWYPEIVSDPRFQNNDWKWELDTVYRLYTGGTRFYGLDNIDRVGKNFEFVSV